MIPFNPKTFNLCEGIVWLILAIVIYFFPLFRDEKNNRGRGLSLFLIFFGISDFIEMNTGAWWKPWWLLIWKAICLGGIVFLLTDYFIKRRKHEA